MNHEQIENMLFCVDDKGNICQTVKGATKDDPIFIAFGKRVAPPEELINLLSAAPFLYQQLTFQFNALQKVIDTLEAMPGNNKEAINGFISMQNGCLLAQSVALNGIENVAKMLKNQDCIKK